MTASRLLLLALPVAALAQTDLPWRRTELGQPGSPELLRQPPAHSRLKLEAVDGALRILDAGTQQGDLLTFERSWAASPETGASCKARVKVLDCVGVAGVMIGFSDGVHEDLLTLYPDRLELMFAKLSAPFNTTDGFHEYQVDIRGQDVAIRVDGRVLIDGVGKLTAPAHQGRNRCSFGSGSSNSTGEALWQSIAWTDGTAARRAEYPVIAGAEQVVVFRAPGVYAPFPALSMDRATGNLYATFAKKTTATHYETGGTTPGRMESTDGGRSWHPVDTIPATAVGPRPGEVFTAKDGALIRIGQNWRKWYPPEDKPKYEGKYRIETPGTYKPDWFAINSGGYLMRSDDGGQTWQRTDIAALDTYASCSSPWSWVQLHDGRVLRAFHVKSGKDDSGDVFVTITADGRTAETHRVTGDPDEKLFFTEETLAYETTKGTIWLLTRVEGGDDQLWQSVSTDGGKTWTSQPSGIVGHPPSGMVKLSDGRLVLTYGYRHPPYGIRAVISNDEGLTWDTAHPITLRNDGAGYDLGYPNSVQLADGTIFTIYYFTDDEQVTHIAGTRWRVP